jgi:hypothetical protein
VVGLVRTLSAALVTPFAPADGVVAKRVAAYERAPAG